MMKSINRLFAIVSLSVLVIVSQAQPVNNTIAEPSIKESKPYKVITAGKQVTVKSTKNIKNIMVWTASGHRIVEQTNVNVTSYTFNVSGAREKIFFIMVQYENGKPFTEKIGIQ
ncbi:MAG: hypothetical protein IPN39_10495 [Chitinophagaceae bacterium]|nr:hypothetical protein [Chitinophagaceae bacterium]MBP6214592.1 hypothetical protein [Chitinophagaceae bacterium]